jgi:hypothetical protein
MENFSSEEILPSLFRSCASTNDNIHKKDNRAIKNCFGEDKKKDY